jgi:hypothetical protein
MTVVDFGDAKEPKNVSRISMMGAVKGHSPKQT